MSEPALSHRGVGIAAVGLALVAVLVTLIAGCGSTGSTNTDGTLRVEVGIYPLEWLVAEVGGEFVTVHNLTAAGAEPHDLELAPRDVARIADADLTVYLAGFQPGIDDAIKATGTDAVLDITAAARLHDQEAHDDHEHEFGSGGHGAHDPHFWLDPVRMEAVATAISKALIARDPNHADAYRANLAHTRKTLRAIDDAYRTTLRSCASRYLVTSHESFGYLSERYDLTQIGITGFDPETEPSATALARVTDFIKRHDITTIYVSPNASAAIGKTVARETGARTAILDPIETLTENSAADNYAAIMQVNLGVLQRGQKCR